MVRKNEIRMGRKLQIKSEKIFIGTLLLIFNYYPVSVLGNFTATQIVQSPDSQVNALFII